MKNQAIIKTHELTKQYGDKKAVDSVNLTVNEGDIYGFIGSNGAGKTTFIRLIMGLIAPTSGNFELFGCSDPAKLGAYRKKIGCIVETPALMLSMTAQDCMDAHRLMYGIKSKSIVGELLKLVGLDYTGNKKVKDFSLGMKQRLAIAQALLNQPSLLILDEPANGMDPQGMVQIRLLLQKLQKENGMTIFVSSHILSELEQLATRFGIIQHGKLVEEFSANELKEKNVSSITISVSDMEIASSLLTQNISDQTIKILDDNQIIINDQKDFSAINRILVEGGVDISIVAKTHSNLEEYFIKLSM